MIARRKHLMLLSNVLPRGYLRMDGYSFNGGTYFDTGELSTEDMKIEMEFTINTVTDQAFFGSRLRLKVRNYSFFVKDGVFYCSANTNQISTDIPAEAGSYSVVYTPRDALINGVKIDYSNNSFVGSLNTVYVGGCHQMMEAYEPAVFVLHGFKFYKGDALLHNYIPCVRLEDGCTGLFDSVENCFKEPSVI